MSLDRLAFLSTPYTKYPGGYDAAYDAARILTRRLLQTRAIVVFSPIVHSHPIASNEERELYLPLNTLMLCKADILLVAHLQNWQESEGIAAEIKHFLIARKPIFDLDPFNLSMARRAMVTIKPALDADIQRPADADWTLQTR